MPDNKILVSRPYYQGVGLGLETWWPRSWSWSRDLVAKVLVSRPGGQGLGLETWWPRSWSWSRAFFKGLDNKSGCWYRRFITGAHNQWTWQPLLTHVTTDF